LTVVAFFCYLEKMKKYHFFLFFLSFVVVRPADCLDVKGFQPIPPYGIFSTFSAESLERGKMGAGLTIEKSLAPDFYRFTFLFAFGVYDNLEIGMTVPYVADWRHETDGFEDISFGIKYRFLDEGKYGPALALLIFGSPPNGKSEFSTEGNYGGGFILSKKIGPVWGHANLLYSRPGTERFNDDITFAGGIDFSASHNVNFLAEIYGKKSYSGSLDRLEPRFGYRMRMGENLYTTLGAGLDIKNRNPEFRLLLTLSYFITPSKKKIRSIEEVD
jgi:hypothetical protein